MSILQQILQFNQQFVEKREYQPYITDKYPAKKLVVITCMDTRLIDLLPRAMNIKNGDVKILKTAGAYVTEPYGSVMRSILIAISLLQAEEVMVVGHHHCGMVGLKADQVLESLEKHQVSKSILQTVTEEQIDLKEWLKGPNSSEEAVQYSVDLIKKHPLLPQHIPVHGLVIDPHTGQLELTIDGGD